MCSDEETIRTSMEKAFLLDGLLEWHCVFLNRELMNIPIIQTLLESDKLNEIFFSLPDFKYL